MDQAAAGVWPRRPGRCVLATVLDRKRASCLVRRCSNGAGFTLRRGAAF
jgi:hypothetical protein